jgi:hypothetical protein
MSTLLEQAIVDAGALRDAALKNAESAVIEKYSDQIKEAVEAILLEQPEDEEDPMADMGMEAPMDAEEDPEAIIDDMPLAAAEGEPLCPCPDEEEEIEINFDELSREMDKHSEVPGETQEMAAADVLGAEEEDLMQEVDIDQDILSSILEELTVDLAGDNKSGWLNPADSMVSLAEEEILALAQDTKEKEKREALEHAMKDLQEAKDSLESKNSLLEENLQSANSNIKKLAEVVTVLKEKLDESSLSNAKLLYTNRVLSSTSLNERQKNHIVEALAKSENVEEAKTIYDTLQNAVSSTSNKKQLNSLSEAVNKTSSTMILSSRQEQQRKDPSLDRWKTLAGLNNNN